MINNKNDLQEKINFSNFFKSSKSLCLIQDVKYNIKFNSLAYRANYRLLRIEKYICSGVEMYALSPVKKFKYKTLI